MSLAHTLPLVCFTVLNNGISLQTHCLPNLSFFLQCLIHLSPSRRVLFMQCLSPDFLPSLFPVVSLVHILFLACFTVLQQRHLHSPSQFHCLSNVALFSLSLCLSPSRRVFPAVSPSYCPSFLSCLSYIFSWWYALQSCNNGTCFSLQTHCPPTVLQQWHFPSNSLFT
jgi:hypothetical protein